MAWEQFGAIEPAAAAAPSAAPAAPRGWEQFGTIEKTAPAANTSRAGTPPEGFATKAGNFLKQFTEALPTHQAAKFIHKTAVGQNEFDYPEFTPETPVQAPRPIGVGDAIKTGFAAATPFVGPLLSKHLQDSQIAQQKGGLGLDAQLARGESGLLDVIKKAHPDLKTEKDKFGNEIVQIGENKYYLNKSGISKRDLDEVYRDTLITLPFGVGAGAALKGAGLLFRMGGQAIAGALGSLSTDAISANAGSDQGVDFGALVFSALGGAGAEALGSLGASIVQRVRTNPARFFDPNSGTLTPEGQRIFAEAGFDPSEISANVAQQFANRVRQTGPNAATARATAADEFGIPLTRGQATGNFEDIAFEQSARAGAKGEIPGEITRARVARQNEAIQEAKNRIADDLVMPPAGTTRPVVATRDPQEAAGVVLEGVRNAERTSADAVNQSYQQVREIAPDVRVQPSAVTGFDPPTVPGITPPAGSTVQGLPQAVRARLAEREVPLNLLNPANAPTENLYPAATQALGIVDNAGTAAAAGRVNPDLDPRVAFTMTAIEELRKSIGGKNGLVNAAKAPADKRAVRAVLQGIDDWIGNLTDDMLMQGGDVSAAVQMIRDARQRASAHFNLFGERQMRAGIDDAGRTIEKMIAGDVTENEVANWLLGSNRIGDSGPAIRVLRRIDEIVGRDGPEWGAIRRAMWQRLAQNTEGKEPLGAQAVASNLAEFLNGKGRQMAELLYSPEELSQMRRFAAVLRSTVPPKGATNPSGSGYEVARGLRDLTNAIGSAGGLMVRIFGTVAGAKNVVKTLPTGAPLLRAPAPIALPAAGAITGQQYGGD